MYGSNFGSKFGKFMGQFSFSQRHIPTKKILSPHPPPPPPPPPWDSDSSFTILRLRPFFIFTYSGSNDFDFSWFWHIYRDKENVKRNDHDDVTYFSRTIKKNTLMSLVMLLFVGLLLGIFILLLYYFQKIYFLLKKIYKRHNLIEWEENKPHSMTTQIEDDTTPISPKHLRQFCQKKRGQ